MEGMYTNGWGMKLKGLFVQRVAGLCAATAAGALRRTIDWRAVYFDPTADPVHPLCASWNVYLGWHDHLFMPVVLRGAKQMVALVSEHGDGEILARAMRHLGWSVARGSTTHGARGALRQLLRIDRRHINLTPDGPKGPRREMALGAMFLASRMGRPVVCIGYGYDRPWRARSWDRFAVPRPFTRGRAVFGPPLYVPSGVDRKGLELYRLWFEKLMNWLTEEAVRWAESGRRRVGEVVMSPNYTPDQMNRPAEPSAPPMPAELAAEWDALPKVNRVAA